MIWGRAFAAARLYALTLGLVMMVLLWRTNRRVGNWLGPFPFGALR
jgi:hypothetical protein